MCAVIAHSRSGVGRAAQRQHQLTTERRTLGSQQPVFSSLVSGHGALRAHQDAHTRALGQLGTRTELDNQSFLNWSENDIIIRQSCGHSLDSGHSLQTAQLMADLTSYQAVRDSVQANNWEHI